MQQKQAKKKDKHTNKLADTLTYTHRRHSQRYLSDLTVYSSHVCQNALLYKVDLSGVDGQSGSLQNTLHISDISTPTDEHKYMQLFQESLNLKQQN